MKPSRLSGLLSALLQIATGQRSFFAKENDDEIGTDYIISKPQVLDTIECVRLCHEEATCVSFGYNPTTSECNLYYQGVQYLTLSQSIGAVIYSRMGAKSTGAGAIQDGPTEVPPATTSMTTSSTTTSTTSMTTSSTTTPPTTSTTTSTTSITTTPPMTRMWADALLSYGTQALPSHIVEYSAEQVLGASDVITYGTNILAWSQGPPWHDEDWVEISYAQRLYMREMYIHETYRVGDHAVNGIHGFKYSTGDYTIIWENWNHAEGDDAGTYEETVKYHIVLWDHNWATDKITVFVDTLTQEGPTEIDAIEVIGYIDNPY